MEKLNRQTQIVILLSLFCVVVLVLIIIYPILPDQIPMQFSFTGEVNRYAQKFMAVLTAILINGALCLYTVLVNKKKIPTKQILSSVLVSVISVGVICASLLIN